MGLQTKTLQHFNPNSAERLFKWALGKTIIPTVTFSLLTILGFNELLGPSPFTQAPKTPLVVFTLGFLVFALVAWAQTRAGIGKNALIAALDEKNLWVRLRSPLNSKVGSQENNFLVALPLDTMKSCQVVSHKTIRLHNHKTSSKLEEFLDLEFEGLDIPALHELLNAERKHRKAASQYHQHFPIKVLKGSRVRLSAYNCDGGAQAIQEALPSSVERKDPTTETTDLR